MQVHVRPATTRDLDAALRLYEEVAGERVWIAAEPPIDLESRRAAWLERYVDGPGAMFVAEADADVVGVATLERRGGLVELGMSVARPSRGKGTGARLLEACISWARSNAIHKVTLQVWPHNDAAIRLYERFGFAREGYLRRHWRRSSGELWDVVVMGLVLDEVSPGFSRIAR